MDHTVFYDYGNRRGLGLWNLGTFWILPCYGMGLLN